MSTNSALVVTTASWRGSSLLSSCPSSEVACRRRPHYAASHALSALIELLIADICFHTVTSHKDTQRWKIEELHRTWKSGACRVEESQLRTTHGVMKWAIIMAATAARIERLKHLHRTAPNADAALEFSRWEIAAAVLMKRKYLKAGDSLPEPRPAIGKLILWLAQFGGYTGKSSGGPPGSITIRRGLDFIAPIAAALEQLELERKM